MKDLIKQVIIDTHFYDSMEKSTNFDNSKFMTFQNLNLSKTDNIQYRKLHELSDEEDILILFYNEQFVAGDFWTADRTYTFSTVFLDDRISFCEEVYKHGSGKEDEWKKYIYYADIDSIEIKSDAIYFFYTKEHIANEKEYWKNKIANTTDSNNKKIWQERHDNCEYIGIGSGFFGLLCFSFFDPIEPFFQKVKESIDSIDLDHEKLVEDYQSEINEALDAEDYHKAYTILEEYDFLKNYLFFQYDYAFVYGKLDKDTIAIETLNELIKTAKEQEINYWVDRAKMFKSTLIEKTGNYYEALQLFNEGLKNFEDKERTGYYSEERSNELYTKYLDNFNQLPYKDRKVIYISNTDEKFKSDTLTVLQSNKLPAISFPAHHPINNETYIGHPFNQNLYIPIQHYDNELLIDRINEFCYLLQCLGATSITIENINSDSNSNNSNKQIDVNVGLSGLKHGIEVDNKNTQKESSERQISLRIGKNQTFNPIKYPYVPSDLTWLSNEASWQRLIKQRLEGSLLEHNEFMSSSQNQVLNTNEINDLKIDLKLFLAQANVNVKKDIDLEIKNSTSTEWKVKVQFKPIEQFDDKEIILNSPNNTPTLSVSTNENEYIEEYVFLAADGEFSERDLRILDRLRQRLNITESRALELTKSLNSYSAEEKELLDEIEFMLEDGEITDREERILLRLANRLGISEHQYFKMKLQIIEKFNR
ncbi:tellurite resistance TerB family protein [Myroides odoratus]|uniref:Uncharacterized protein n=1 Tax=Myroides odoratus TaxID=256 RepID=A0A9Q6ZIY3_MYROD|nr:hypothetical protein [Myroides odoratus]EHQ43927.1 hypothetical protein Myrod_3110 [Myroides odoratus DSM 2801]EKB04956.1 hypothetical protein HMPREF9716_02987 [Myroides odoratus CIP 103059]QQU01229.1 hypothetical protein I6I88_05615 [Myroides odoratus]WQD56513.1 hypothetical protein U0010_13415 [Myroides odoratus]STZ31203.1 Uncharacterised protein [Myroides odoratus]